MANLRKAALPDVEGLCLRVVQTEGLVGQVLRGDPETPNLIDGAVFTREVGGVPAYFEADAVAAHFDEPIRVGEIKSFPTVDGQADADKVGAALSQVAIYILLLQDLVARLGGPPDKVSTEAMLITPRNTGLQPTLTVKAVERQVERARRILERAPRAVEVARSLPASVPGFGQIR